ncbi:MAG: hypothetical protein HY870_23250 [Chloroflexi bacterium]|nr:hypothetical protein [Chloroflexota bacterium]
MMDNTTLAGATTVLEQAAMLWLELWELAGEKWPPDNVALAWRLYERLKRKLIGRRAPEPQAIMLCDEFFRGAHGWGNLAIVTNHRRPIDALTVVLIDVDMAELEDGKPSTDDWSG